MGVLAPQHVGSSQTRDRTLVPCTGRQILYCWASREALLFRFLKPWFALFKSFWFGFWYSYIINLSRIPWVLQMQCPLSYLRAFSHVASLAWVIFPLSTLLDNSSYDLWVSGSGQLFSQFMSEWVKVAQPCPTLCDPVDCNPAGFSVHGILQAKILEWLGIPFSRGSFWLRDWTRVSSISGRLLYHLSHEESPSYFICHLKLLTL